MLSRLLCFPRPRSPVSWMVLACAVLALLAGGCAPEEAPAPGEPPNVAAVAAPPVDPGQAALEKELAEAEQEVERWRKAGDSEKEIEELLHVGRVRIDLGEPQEAISSFQKALSRSRATGNGKQEAAALRNLGFVLINENAPEEARRYLEEGLRVSSQLGDEGRQADLLHLIATSYSNQGDHAKALARYEQGLRLAESSGELGLAADILNAMGIVHSYRAEMEAAQDCAERALKLARKEGAKGAEAAILTSLGAIHRRRGELERAQVLLSEAAEINRRLGKPGDVAKVLNHLGGVYLDLGEKERALQEYERALAIHRSSQSNLDAARALISIGQVHLLSGKTEIALKRFQEAWELSREGKKPRTPAAALHGVGATLLKLERTEDSVRALEAALPLRREGGDRLGEASTLLELGKAYQTRGELDRAGSAMQEALDLSRQAEASFVQAASLFALARLDRDRGRLEDARRRIEEAIRILESVRSDLPGDRLKSSFFASKRSYYDFYIDLLMRLDRRHPGQGYAARALEASERARARSLLDLLVEGRHEVTHGIDPGLKRQESDIAARLSQIQGELIEELSRESANEKKIEALRTRLARTEEERQTLERRIRARHPRYAEVRYPSPLDPEQIRKRLDGETALLEYALGAEGSYLFVLTRDSLEVYPLPDARKIADQVQRARKGLERAGGRSLRSYALAARWLYEKLMAPSRPVLAGKRLLMIVPDGPLHSLSFEALLTGDETELDPAEYPYLLREFALSYIPSASVLPLLTEPESQGEARGASKQFVALADPIYEVEDQGGDATVTRGGSRAGLRALSRLPRLIGSLEEVSRIASRFPPAKVEIYKREAANEENVKQNPLAGSARWLHFATHGVLDEERPALSGLRLTRTGKDDGLLQVYEIFNLDLKSDLVVLSACETGLGKLVTGEGLVGVTRAFLYAGAPSVVVSLWRVQDDTAPDLMVEFYGGLDRLDGKAEALRQAKLALIRGGGRRAHPYFWAPFILVGRPE